MDTDQMAPDAAHSMDQWLLDWRSPFQTHDYAPLYLANGTFGGMLDLSGATMDLWSSEIGCMPASGNFPQGVLCPVTVLRTQVFFRNDHFRERGFWVGASGIHCDDPRYTADTAMPHIAQVYDCHQQLDLRAGIASTLGTLALGSSAAVGAADRPERAIPFRTRVIFLKDSAALGIEIEADAEMLFLPELVLAESFVLKGGAKGILRHGNEIDCTIELHQQILSSDAADGTICYTIQPDGHASYQVRVSSPDSSIGELAGLPAFIAHKRAFFLIEILPTGHQPVQLMDSSAFEAEQRRRWAAFWDKSDLQLPPCEALWQQRYRASLFYVAQSIGRGATQPVGLSKPMVPYWFGCFHDTDTYFCRPLLETGHFDEAHRHLDYRRRGLSSARRIAAALGQSGALYPWQADSAGNGPAGDIPMNSAIIACEAWHQFLYSGRPHAREAATEILTESFANLCHLLDFSGDSVTLRSLPLMTFSETMTAEDPAEVRIACRATAAALLAAAEHLEHAPQPLIARARRVLDELDLPIDASGQYRFCPSGNPEYLRCPSVTLGSFPLHSLHADSSLAASFADELARILFLFAWLPHQASVVASQLGQRDGPTSASALLRSADAFYKPGHSYDEWENRRSVRAQLFVTAAGGFCTAIHHMLAAETAPGVWSIFPGIPPLWLDLSFRDLHLRCGWTVSATLKDGRTVAFSAKPTHASAPPDIHFQLPGGQPLDFGIIQQ